MQVLNLRVLFENFQQRNRRIDGQTHRRTDAQTSRNNLPRQTTDLLIKKDFALKPWHAYGGKIHCRSFVVENHLLVFFKV